MRKKSLAGMSRQQKRSFGGVNSFIGRYGGQGASGDARVSVLHGPRLSFDCSGARSFRCVEAKDPAPTCRRTET